MRIKRTTTAGAVALALLLAGGCGAVAEKATEKAAEKAIEADGNCENVDLDLDSGGGGVSADCGGESIDIDAGGGASLPDGFPADLAPPAEANIIFATSSGDGFTVTAGLDGDIDAVFEGIKTQLTDAGYTIDNEASTDAGGTQTRNVLATGSEYSANVTVTDTANAAEGNLSVSYILATVTG